MKPVLIGVLVLAVVLLVGCVWLTQPLAGPRASETAKLSADPERLRAHVEFLAGPLSDRNHAHPRTLDRASRALQERFAEAGASVSLQRYQVNGADYANVIARFGPKDGRPVIVGAHYDAASGTPGADDNASGVAGLLELARLLGQGPLAGPVELVAYTLEEPPYFRSEHMGSRRHADALVAAGIRPTLVLVMEMIGYFDDRPGTQRYPVDALKALYPDRGDFIAVVGNLADASEVRRVKAAMAARTPLPVYSINAPASMTGVDFSDHASYWEHGIPALMVTDTAFYRNPHYHQPSDLPATLDYRRMALVVDGVAAAVRAFVERP